MVLSLNQQKLNSSHERFSPFYIFNEQYSNKINGIFFWTAYFLRTFFCEKTLSLNLTEKMKWNQQKMLFAVSDFFFKNFKKLFGFVGNSHFRSLEKHKMEPTFVTPFEPTSIFNLHCEHSVILQKFSVMPCAASKDIMFSHYLSCYISTIPKCPRSHEKFVV